MAEDQTTSDAGTGEAGPRARRTGALVLRSALRFFAICSALWVVFYAAYAALPYTRSGADVIYEAKTRRMRSPAAGEHLFAAGSRVRVLVMGNSKVLAGFRPDVFDRLVGGGVSSFNAGLPGDDRFLPDLEAVLAGADAPTVVLLTMPWADASSPRQGRSFDARVADAVFPFRHLPRDLTLFALRARSRGGFKAYYRQGARSVGDMLAAGGYYFIEGQSHFPGGKLPADFHLESDKPGLVRSRGADAGALEFSRLCALLREHHVRAYYVPIYLREGEAAPAPPANPAWDKSLANCDRLAPLGPDYWLLPNALFADPIHTNPEGARVYTEKLAALVGPVLRSP